MNALRRLFARPSNPNRGTLTFLRDGRVILGFPTHTTAARAFAVREGIKAWAERPDHSLVTALPFPVDVTDLRR